MAFAFLLSMPGAPFVYYGDEIGMRYVEGLTSVEGGFNRTGSRSPMQWDNSVNAGFSAAPSEKLYIRQDEDQDRPTVQKQMQDENSLFNEVRKLIRVRQSCKALQSKGEIEFVCVKENAYPFAYVRSCEGERILVVINPSGRDESFSFDGKNGETIYVLGRKAELKEGVVSAPAASVSFIRL